MPASFSGTITTGGTAQPCIPPLPVGGEWHGYRIQNTSVGVLYIDDTGAVATLNSQQIAAGATYTSPPGCVPYKGVSIYGATTNQAFNGEVF